MAREVPLARTRNIGIIAHIDAGKTTVTALLTRLYDVTEGSIEIGGVDIATLDARGLVALRRRVGMIFQRSNPFPMSIYDNVAYGVRVNGLTRDRLKLDEIVERTLRGAALWDEVKDRLGKSAMGLSGPSTCSAPIPIVNSKA